MSLGSTVSFVWGVQIETVPLLLGSQCYESYHQAEIFFALLSLRIRTNTLRLELNSSSSLLPRPSLASLPPEVTDMILDELFGTLYSDRRRDLIEMLGSCCCSFERKRARGSQDEGEHECGIDCSSWNDCCSRAKFHSSPGWISSDEHDCHGNSEARRDLWNDYGGGTPVLELAGIVRIFRLNLISLPSFADVSYRGPTLPLSVVGLPAASPLPPPPHSSDGHVPVACAQLHQSYMEIEVEIEVEDETETTAVSSVPSFRTLSLEQRKRFSRFLRVTRLTQAETRKVETSRKLLRRGEESEMEFGDEKGGIQDGADASRHDGSSVQPSLLLVHRSWSFSY